MFFELFLGRSKKVRVLDYFYFFAVTAHYTNTGRTG